MKKAVIGVAGAVVLLAGGITAFLLLRPQKADINVNLSGQNVTEAEADIPFNILISRKAKSTTTATIEVDGESYTGEIAVGEKNCTIMVPNPYKDDVYTGDQVVKAKVTAVTGSHIGAVDLNTAQTEVSVTEILDTTLVEISAKDAVEGDANVEFTITLSNPVKTDATVDVDVDNSEYTVEIAAGESEAILEVKNPNENDTFYDPSTMKAVVTGFTGGDFEAVDFEKASVVANIFDSVDATSVTLTTADNKEGAASILFTVSLSSEAKKDAEITVNVGGTDYKVQIPANSKSAVLEVENPNKEDPYIDASTLEGKVTNVTGGGFESIDFSKASATARISDTTDITRATLIAEDTVEGVENAVFTVSLTSKAQTKVTASVEVEGKSYTVTIPAGQDSATLSVKNSNSEDPYSDATKLTGKLTQVSGGNFEYLVIGKDDAVLNINDTVDSTVVSISADDIVEGAENIVFDISLSNVPVTKTAMTVVVSGTSYEVTIPAGSTSTTLTVANTNSEDYYKDASSVTAKVTEFSGGLFEDVDLSNASETVYIADTTNTTKMTLSASDIHEGDANIVYTVKLSNKAQTDMDVTLKAGGAEYPATIKSGNTSVNISVPNTNGDDVYTDASTLYGEIVDFDGGNFEKVDDSNANTSANILDTVDTTNVSLATSDLIEGTANINFTVTLSNPAKTDAEITVDIDGQNQKATVAAGSATATITIANTNVEDVYADASKVIGTVTAVNGGNFEKVDFSSATATANISDTTDTTAVTLTATDTDESAEKIIYTATLSNAAQTEVTVTVTANGNSFTGTISAGATSGTIEVTNPNKEDAIIDASTLEGVVTDVIGGNFENVDFSSAKATAVIADTTTTTTVSLSADDIDEGNSPVIFNVELSNAADTEATVTVTVNGVGYNAVIAAGEKSGSVSVSHTNTEDVYQDASSMTGTVTAVLGGNFESVDFSGVTATADINDTKDTTTVTLTANDTEEGTSDIGFTVSFDNPAETSTTITVDVDGTEYKPVMSANTSSVSFTVTNTNTEDAYLDASTVTGKVTAVGGGNYEDVDFSGATTTVDITDTIDDTTITLTAPADTEEGAELVFEVALGNAPKNTPATVTIDVDGKKFTGTVAVDATTGTITVTNPYSDDAYIQNNRTVTATVDSVSGGNFERVAITGVSADATVIDSKTTTTSLTLTAPEPTEEGSALIFTVELGAAGETDTTVNLAVGGNIYLGTILAGETKGTVTVDNPFLDDVYIQSNRTVIASVYDVTGGNFEKVNFSGVSANAAILDKKTNTSLTLTAPAPTEEGSDLLFNVVLGAVAETDTTVTLTVDSDTYTGTINSGETACDISVANPYSDDAYVQEDRTVTATVTEVKGGNFENVDYKGKSADATVIDSKTTDTSITLDAPAEDIDEGDNIIFTFELGTAAKSETTVTLTVDSNTYTGTIAEGETTGTVTVTSPYSDDAYIQSSRKVTATVTDVTGGDFENVVYSGVTAEATVVDKTTTTSLTLTAPEPTEEGSNLIFNVELGAAAETDTTVTLTVDSNTYSGTINSGETACDISVANPYSDDAYIQEDRTVTATVTEVKGGNFENVDYDGKSADATVKDKETDTTVTIYAPDSLNEGENIDYEVELGVAAETDAKVILDVNGETHEVEVPANETTGTLTISNPFSDDAYTDDAREVIATVTEVKDGNFENVDCSSISATATTQVLDNTTTTTVTVTGPDSDVNEGESFDIKISLDNATKTAAEATVTVGTDTQTVDIPAGSTEVTVTITNPNIEDVVIDSEQLTVAVTGLNDGGFEDVDCSGATTTVSIVDTEDTTTCSISGPESVTEGEGITYTVTVSNAPATDATVTLLINEQQVTGTLSAGETTTDITVTEFSADDPYTDDGRKVEAKIYSIGIYEKLENDSSYSATVVTTVTTKEDITELTLSVDDYKPDDEKLTYRITLSNPAQGTSFIGNILVNGSYENFTVEVGSDNTTVVVDNIPVNRTATMGSSMGGNFEKVNTIVGTATAKEITTVTVNGSDSAEGDTPSFVISLSSPAKAATTVTVVVTSDAGFSHTYTLNIPEDASGVMLTVVYEDNVYKDSKMKAEVTDIKGDNNTAWDIDSASREITIADSNIDTTTVSAKYISGNNYEGVITYTYKVTLSNPALKDTDVYIKIGDEEPCKVTVKAGETTAEYQIKISEGDPGIAGNHSVVVVTSVGTNDFEDVNIIDN